MKRIGFIVSPNFQVMSLAALPVFEFANRVVGKPLYDLQLLSEHGGLVRSSFGLTVETTPFDDPVFDTLIVGGGTEIEESGPRLREFILMASKESRRIASICSGAFVLAEAGLLDGRRATTHWFNVAAFRSMFPNVRIEEDRIFIVDGPIWTSAGMSAGIDLALALVESDIGEEATKTVAKLLVVYHRRSGGQMQFSALIEMQPKSDRIQNALNFAKQNLSGNLTVDTLAASANLSPRQFSRAFQAETGQTPAKAIEILRAEAARMLMENGRLPVDTVALQTGFGDRERMRRAFMRIFGQPPQAIRRSARQGREDAPTYDLESLRAGGKLISKTGDHSFV